MLSELSVNNAGGHAGAVLYDGACGVCSAGARRWAGAVGRAGLRMVPLQSPEARALSGRTDAELRREMTVVTPDR